MHPLTSHTTDQILLGCQSEYLYMLPLWLLQCS
nr:MAG TPA: hypothetical protein [Caudoviricetes sp.]